MSRQNVRTNPEQAFRHYGILNIDTLPSFYLAGHFVRANLFWSDSCQNSLMVTEAVFAFCTIP